MNTKDIAYIDDLTGIGNRRAFMEDLGKDLSMPKEQLRGLYLALTDLDHFKRVNDSYGHLSGDYLIKEFSKQLVDGVKSGDNVVSRYGGDEFVIIFRKTNKEEVLAACNKMREELSAKEFLLPEVNKKIKITMSIGIAEYPADGETWNTLFAKADEALYSSKQLGRNRTSLAKEVLAQVKEEKRIQDLLVKPPLIGREKELSEIKDSLHGEKHQKLIVISGDTGVGKTRMLEEIAITPESKKKETFFLTCTEADKDKPYSLIVDAIDIIGTKHQDMCRKAFDSLKHKHKLALSAIPKLNKFAATSRKATSPAANMRLDIFNGLCEFFAHIFINIKPLLLIDNMDWIDAGTAEVISYLIVSQKQTPLLICGVDNHPATVDKKRKAVFLDGLLDEISEFEIVPRINLMPLSEGQAKDLFNSIFITAQAPKSFLEDVYVTTKGNPFFITELLRDFIEKRIVSLKYPTWVFNVKKEDFPKDLKDLLEKKLQKLNQEEKELLFTAAGIGRSFKFDFLSKLKKINKGHIQDVMSKVAGKNIFSEDQVNLGDVVSFNNDIMRTLLYKSLDEGKKMQLHLDIATAIEEENKADVGSVSTELAFHFNKAKLEPKAKEYASLAVKYAHSLFLNKEIEKLIEDAIAEREEKDKFEPIKEEAWPFVMEIMSAFNAAVRGIRFYQRDNVITSKAINRLMDNFASFFKIQGSITLSNPEGVSKDSSKLLINGHEFRMRSSAKDVFSKNLAEIMRNSHIGSITFRQSISKDEAEGFISALKKPFIYKGTQEKWQKILADENIISIKIDEVIYRRVLSEEEKKWHQKEFMKDFLATEAAMGAVGDALKEAMPSQSSNSEGAAAVDKKIEGVTKKEKNILAKTIAKLPVDVIVETIANEYMKRKGAILDIKDMLLVCLKDLQQRNQLMPRLHERLEKLGLSEECFQWLIDEKGFLEYPVRKRTNIYINTDVKTILEMGVVENLKPTLEELFNLQEDASALDVMGKWLLAFQNELPEFRVYASVTFADIVKIIPARMSDSQKQEIMQKIADGFLSALKLEKEPAVRIFMVKNVAFLMSKLLELKDYANIYRILSAVNTDKNVLKDIDVDALSKALLKTLEEESFDKDRNEVALNIFKILGAVSIPYLLDLLLLKVSDFMPFEWYLQERQIIDILKSFKTESISEIEKLLASKDERRATLALEILIHFKDPKLIYIYRKALLSASESVRNYAIKALIMLDTEGALKLLQELLPSLDAKTTKYIIATMSTYSKSKAALQLLKEIRTGT